MNPPETQELVGLYERKLAASEALEQAPWHQAFIAER